MIRLYTGTPGSGKSLHVAQKVVFRLKTLKRPVISTFDVNLDVISEKGKYELGRFIYIPINEINPKILYEYAYKNHVKGKEGQTLVIIDECQIIFNPREFGLKGRLDWINFFTQHRHLGFDFILVTQFDRLLDRQIRCLLEYEVKHRKVNNRGLLCFLPISIFVSIEIWYGIREKLSSEFFTYKKKYASIYDSYSMFDKFISVNNIGKENEKREDAEINEGEAGATILEMGVGGSPSRGRKRRRKLFTIEPIMLCEIKT